MGFLTSIWTWLIGALLGAVGFVKMFVLYQIRLRDSKAAVLYSKLSDGYFLSVSEEYTEDPLPREYTGIGYLSGIFLRVSFTERLLKAGWASTDTICYITCFRFQKKKMIKFLDNFQTDSCPKAQAFILETWDSALLCDLGDTGIFYEDVYPMYPEIDSSIKAVVDGKAKTGILLYGPPGNGKSFLIKHFAIKYSLPIQIVAFRPTLTNHDFLKMFSRLKGPCIILMEDFDNVFDKRQNLLAEAQFTLDAILNVVDGAFLNSRKLIFMMTANDISRIDYALKNRPSRFGIVTEIGKPSAEVKAKYLSNQYFRDKDLSLDEMFFVEDNIRHGIPPEKIDKMLLSLSMASPISPAVVHSSDCGLYKEPNTPCTCGAITNSLPTPPSNHKSKGEKVNWEEVEKTGRF